MKTKKMNKRVKRLWVAALRSGKYRQGTGQLKHGNAYCCLGVLTDLWMKECKTGWDSSFLEIRSDSEFLDNCVMDWAGLKETDPIVIVGSTSCSLASLNDEGVEEQKPFSFRKISDVIQKQL